MKYLFFNSIRGRLIFWFSIIFAASFIVYTVISYVQMRDEILDREKAKLESIRDLKVREIDSWIDKIAGDMRTLISTEEIKVTGHNLCIGSPVGKKESQSLVRLLDSYINNYNIYYEIFIVSAFSSTIVYSTSSDNVGQERLNNAYISETLKANDIFIKDIYYSRNLNVPTMTFSIPLSPARYYDTRPAGVLVARIYLERSLYNFLLDRTGLGGTGETMIINSSLTALNRLREYDGFPLTLKVKDEASIQALAGKSGVLECSDYRGEKVLAAFRHIPRLKWGFVAKQDIHELLSPIYSMVAQKILILMFIMGAFFLVGFFLSRDITEQINSLIAVSNRIRSGDYSFRIMTSRDDEFSRLSESFNKMADLIISQLNIQKASSEIIHVMVSTLNQDEFSRNVLRKLVETTESIIGAFYILTRDGNEFKHLTSIGLDIDAMETFHAESLEGEFGRALATREIAKTRNISLQSLVKLRTIVGDVVPTEIMTIPIIVNNRTVAIISLASLKEYDPEAMTILESIRPVMNTAFANIISDEETRRLARELSDKNQLLMNQKTELETQAMELTRQRDTVRKQNRELEQQRVKVEEASRLKNEFLSNMSHELRTPLNSIMALSRVLIMQTKEKLDEEERGYLEIIDRNGGKLLALINDILDLSKIESGRIDLKIREISIESILRVIVDNLEQMAEEKGIKIVIAADEDLPRVESDESRIYQILQNIIGNAVKFTEQGAVTVTVTKRDEEVIVAIEDTGIGIAETDLPHIFEEFRQVDGTLSRKYSGTGLGLTIASKSALLISSKIEVESSPGIGSCFRVIIPVAWREPELAAVNGSVTVLNKEQEQAKILAGVPDTGRLTGTAGNAMGSVYGRKTVLVVDDDHDNIIVVQAVLQSQYEILYAYDGQEAMDLIMKERPDVILLDMSLPGKSGFVVVKELKTNDRTRRVPVIALTAMTMTGDRERILRAGCDDYIPKPYNIDELKKKIAYWMELTT
ncbi:MAG: hypothetical protein CVV44_20465 [Spirochaetae bacterium HGW-Spirochaetae-1]|jgi:signal transduction histidine kinase/CheY-like chemotaxis protein/HAMP domain-containing protein|nr:MAG: hypothetical protein CVV44_20465 [Spirochaetae bacterium HGW-Spirochaetae-1]